MSKEQLPEKNMIFNLREWLTIPEAALHFSKISGETINEADMLRLALDRHITLSLNFLNKIVALEVVPSLPKRETSQRNLTFAIDELKHSLGKDVCFAEATTLIEGIWDLLLVNNGQSVIESLYQTLTDGPEIRLNPWTGIFLAKASGQMIVLLELLAKKTDKRKYPYQDVGGYPWSDPQNFKLATTYPKDDVLLVVKKSSLISLQEYFSGNTQSELKTDASYFDINHPFYAKELKIAVEAWTELYEKNPPPHVPQGGHKKYITKWLVKNYPELSDRAFERIATIVNPNSKGGASPTE